MAMVECDGCGKEISTQSIKCPDCGTLVGYSGGTTRHTRTPHQTVESVTPAPRREEGVVCPMCGLKLPGRSMLDLHLERVHRVAEQRRPGQSESQVQANLNEANEMEAKSDILWGSVWFFGGAIVTAGGYMLAQGGGVYLITWGAIIFGGYQLLKGLSNLYSAVGWKGSKGAVLTVASIILVLGVIGASILNEKGQQSTEHSTLSVQIDSNKQKLAALNSDMDSYDVTLNGLQARLDSIQRRYPSLVLPEPEYSQYNRILNEYNSTGAKRNALFDDYERLRITTNSLVDQYNALR